MRGYSSFLAASATSALLFATPTAGITAEPSPFCADVLHLIEQSRTQFTALDGSYVGNSGANDRVNLLDADRCSLTEDAEKTSYRCVWTHDFDGPTGDKQFARILEDIRACVQDIATEHQDMPVNHPDSFASTYFEFGHGIVSVSLKKKRALMATLVSVRIDGDKTAAGPLPH